MLSICTSHWRCTLKHTYLHPSVRWSSGYTPHNPFCPLYAKDKTPRIPLYTYNPLTYPPSHASPLGLAQTEFWHDDVDYMTPHSYAMEKNWEHMPQVQPPLTKQQMISQRCLANNLIFELRGGTGFSFQWHILISKIRIWSNRSKNKQFAAPVKRKNK